MSSERASQNALKNLSIHKTGIKYLKIQTSIAGGREGKIITLHFVPMAKTVIKHGAKD